ncbi:helicase-related protein [Sutcliffiella rhizosphaerae]|uniref:ATP-dependent RNA helicase DeaD n=1 Tax=Sutcliffiella rhizosphaerae TaxID=2880967 RepID=A0ABN8AC38_9BACI|nr:helicase-related protein [Sutcliffiella rhizosphaerae]CAG9621617.1 ATP-dependent RNA helicase DeaD [Sutcliffiella rhizosphaerae]
MNKFNLIYEMAQDRTKYKVEEDIQNFMESKNDISTPEQYVKERSHYLDQIWINVWLNKVTNDVSRKEKKQILSELDYDTEGMDKKIINQLFRNEMRNYQPFDTLNWLLSSELLKQGNWQSKFDQVKKAQIKRQEEEELKLLLENSKEVIFSAAQNIVEMKRNEYFLYVRHFVAKKLNGNFNSNKKYEEIYTNRGRDVIREVGKLQYSDYLTLKDFFSEYTGAVHQIVDYDGDFIEYETYFTYYEKNVTDFLFGFFPSLIKEEIKVHIIGQFELATHEELSDSILRKMLANSFHLLVHEYMEKLQDDFIIDLIQLADTTFDLPLHQKQLLADIQDREYKLKEREEELRRQQEKEQRMMDDIFGKEYIPSTVQNVKYVMHVGETNTGKTFHALKRMKAAKSGLYLAPLRLLALEVYDQLNAEGVRCTLKTGEEEKVTEGASHVASTVEMFHEREYYDILVIDEAQMIADKDRGFSWYKAITKANSTEVHIIGSFNMKEMILQLLGDANVEVIEYTRDTPLKVETKTFVLSDTQKGDALVCFSRKRVLETASILQNNGHSVSMIYGSMPPETRKKQIKRFLDRETTVIVATDAIGMGLNLPIRRIVFLQNDKFDGTRRRRLTSQEVKQIAGRAGRKGIYNVGRVSFTSDIKEMERLLTKKDKLVHTFAIAPTSAILNRFEKYFNKLSIFFELWDKFKSPIGTEKATLTEEQLLYEEIEDSMIEARLSIQYLYSFLHMPFSKNEQLLIDQWKNTMEAIVSKQPLPEPYMSKNSLETTELSYKSIGLYLLFLYRLDRRTEASYWEKVRESFSDEVHEKLNEDVISLKKTCKKCRKKLDPSFSYEVCDACHYTQLRKQGRNNKSN